PHNPARRDGTSYSVAEQRAKCPYFGRWSGGYEVSQSETGFRTSALGLPYVTQYPPDAPIYIYDPEIDIEDTYSAVVRFRGGPSMAYSIIFSAPWEGYRLAINGTHGRIEASTVAFPDQDDPDPSSRTITYYPMFGKPEVHEVATSAGGHDGADPLLQQDLFVAPSEESVRLGLTADSRQGAHAVAVGEAVWRSARDNRPYDVRELLGEFA
ncbi:MAG TPA: Gfo/Idh/MocA family oxidoreductase, partial [Actinopolymorphaceae bacterium]|nr:Gfo/Idh/MocA family oxidoreductase [Actinopolymorphaceae bacterium]